MDDGSNNFEVRIIIRIFIFFISRWATQSIGVLKTS